MAKRLTHVIAAASMMAATFAALPASAQQPPAAPAAVVTTVDPQDIVQIMQDSGFRATIVENKGQQVDIETRLSGLNVHISLLGCTNGRQCASFQMRMNAEISLFGLTNGRRPDVEAAMVATNRWHDHRRYTSAHVYYSANSNMHLVALIGDLSLIGGSTREAIAHTIRNYGDLAGEFVAFMRDPANRQMPNL